MSGTPGTDADLSRIGLLLEAAHAQQEVIAAESNQLQEQVRGLDEVVRIQIRRTLHEELVALEDRTRAVLRALESLEKFALRRRVISSLLVCGVCLLMSAGVIGLYAPGPHELELLRMRREALERQIQALEQAGAGIDLRRCGHERRWCVRVDRSAGAFGDGSEYMLVLGP